MKTKELLCRVFPIFAGALLAAAADSPGQEPRLRGIVCFSTNEFALLENTALPAWRGVMMLGKGQREGDTEVLEISSAAGKVRLREAGKPMEVGFEAELPPEAWLGSPSGGQKAEPGPGAFFLRLQQAGPAHVFKVYQLLAGRSLIRPSALPAFRLDVGCKDAAGTEDLRKAIERALAPKGIMFRLDGEKFVLAGSERDLGRVTPQVGELAAQLGRQRAAAAPGTAEQVLGLGTINFPGTDVNQVLTIYQELANRTLLRPATLPAPIISFQNRTPLTLVEALYAFQALLAMNGVSVQPVGEQFLFVFPTLGKAKLDALLARKPAARSPARNEKHAAGTIDLQRAGLTEVAALYGQLCGQPVEVEPGLPEWRFVLRSQTTLTTEELLQALDLVLGWSDLTVTPVEGGKSLRVTPMQGRK